MSIKFYYLLIAKNKNKIVFVFLINFLFLLNLFLVNKSFASIGYEENTNIMIDTVDSVCDVYVGEDILYYDFTDKKYYNGFIDFKDNSLAGIRIEIKEIETDRIRTFLIDYEDC